MKTEHVLLLVSIAIMVFCVVIGHSARGDEEFDTWITDYDVRDQELQPWVTGPMLLESLEQPGPVQPETKPHIYRVEPEALIPLNPEGDGIWDGVVR